MKHYLYTLLVTLVVLAVSCKPEEKPNGNGENEEDPIVPPSLYEHYVFDLSALPSITIEVSTQQWNELLSNFDQNPKNEEKVAADFIFNKNGVETRLNNIAFRIRGNSSRRRPEIGSERHNPQNPIWQSAHFAVDFREFVSSNRLFGLRKLILKWHKDDNTYCREVYSYDMFARFGVWTSPRVSYAKVYIKIKEDPRPAYFGIFAMIEQIDEAYLWDRADFFETTNGNVWKFAGGADLMLNGALARMGVEDIHLDESKSLRYTYDLKTNKGNVATAKTEFNTWLTNLNNLTGQAFRTWIDANFDVDLFLRAYAVNVAIGQWDGYWGNANNYYLYFESTSKKGYYMPYDYDNTLGTVGPQGFFDAADEDVLRWGGSNSRPLINKILAIPEYQQKYLDYLNEFIDPAKDLVHVDRSIPRIQGWHNLIKDHIKSDCIENNEHSHSIIDRAASWGSHQNHRILQRGSNNFFERKEAAIKRAH